jgi:hypothetical protein
MQLLIDCLNNALVTGTDLPKTALAAQNPQTKELFPFV